MDLKNRIMERLGRTEAVSRIAEPGSTPPARIPAKPQEPLAVRALSESEMDWLQRIHQKLMSMIDLSLMGRLEDKQARAQIREISERIMDEQSVPLSAASRQFLAKCIEDEILGLGPIEPLLADSTIADILVNGSGRIYVERYGKLELTPLRFQNDAHLLNVIDRIVSSVGRRIDESSPMVDARLKDGSRVNAIIPPLAIDGPTLSIRRFTIDRLHMEDMIELGTLTATMGELLKGIVKARLNVLISGGTGSGKTTLLNVLSGYIPETERIITIEDSAELQLQQPHVVRLETRPPNIEGRGEIRQRDLVRNSLRMRPDRIVVGEVRSDEAFDMLQAMNTGHDGSLTTVHANSSRDALGRLENMVAMTGLDLPARMVRTQIASAINVVLQLARLEDGRRKLISVQEIQGMEGDIITMSEIFSFQRKGVDENGNVLGAFRATGIVPKFHDRLQKRGIDLSFDIFDPERSE
ncbi:CpaF family protein [Methyloterricola oryzae]|uniref:CpaF family protein n=1 Tax=Methyloterricola oryzae TaxID=1495050 RepID=UPI0005EAFC1A|nr:CpaF family protein [Methyloterricola oryzae]